MSTVEVPASATSPPGMGLRWWGEEPEATPRPSPAAASRPRTGRHRDQRHGGAAVRCLHRP